MSIQILWTVSSLNVSGFSLSFLSHKVSQITRSSVTWKQKPVHPRHHLDNRVEVDCWLLKQWGLLSVAQEAPVVPVTAPHSLWSYSVVSAPTRDPFPVALLKTKPQAKATEQDRMRRKKEGYWYFSFPEEQRQTKGAYLRIQGQHFLPSLHSHLCPWGLDDCGQGQPSEFREQNGWYLCCIRACTGLKKVLFPRERP